MGIRGRWTVRSLSARAALVLVVGFAGVGFAGATAAGAHAAPPAPVAAGAGAGAGATSGAGWAPEWRATFAAGSLPAGCRPYNGPYGGGASYWTPADVVVSGGLLRLVTRREAVGGKQYTTGAIGCQSRPQTYGRWTVRARIPRGRGIDSGFSLWPTTGGEGSWSGVELLAPGPETAYVTNGYGGGTIRANSVGTFSDAFHTYVLTWTPTGVSLTVDGRVLYRGPQSYAGPRWLAIQVNNGDALTGVPDAATPLPAEFQIAGITVERYRPGSAAPASSRPAAAAPGATGAGAGPGALVALLTADGAHPAVTGPPAVGAHPVGAQAVASPSTVPATRHGSGTGRRVLGIAALVALVAAALTAGLWALLRRRHPSLLPHHKRPD